MKAISVLEQELWLLLEDVRRAHLLCPYGIYTSSISISSFVKRKESGREREREERRSEK